MTLLAGAAWTITDDDGMGTTGTAGNAAWVAAIKASIETAVHSAANPTVLPSTITDEVITARGSKASLDARLDISLNEDGTLITGALPVGRDVRGTLGATNLCMNELFYNWYAGDAAAPAGWALAGAGGTIARAGSGLADTNFKIGSFCAKVTRAAATTTLTQRIFLVGAINLGVLQTGIDLSSGYADYVGYGAWVRADAIGAAKLFIDDGVGVTYSAANAAAGTWEWLTVTRYPNGATKLSVGIENVTNGASVYLSAPTCFINSSGYPPVHWVPSPIEYASYDFRISGAVAVATPKFIWAPHRPIFVKDVQLAIITAPTGANLIVDVNTWDAAAFTSMFSTRPQIVAAANVGGAQPDTTYARRCAYGLFGTGTGVGTRISIDIDQVGSGVAGSDLCISLRCLQPSRFMESIIAHDFQG